VHIRTGMIWSDIVIESSGGTDPITSHGHRKADALRIRELIERYQGGCRPERACAPPVNPHPSDRDR